MARLQKFTGVQSLPGVASPQVVADIAVGEAKQRLGAQIGRTARSFEAIAGKTLKANEDRLNKLSSRQQAGADKVELTRAKVSFDAAMRTVEAEQREQTRSGKRSYSETLLAQRHEAAQAMIQDLPKDLQFEATQKVQEGQSAYVRRLAAQEYADSLVYYTQSAVEIVDLLAEEIRESPDCFDSATKTIDEFLEALPVSGKQKTSLSRLAHETLGTAWIKTRPIREQIDGLANLEVEHQSLPESDVDAGSQELKSEAPRDVIMPDMRADRATQSASLTAFIERAQSLPPKTRSRLLVEAQQDLARATFQEANRITGLIDADPLAIDLSEISENDLLNTGIQAKLHGKVEKHANEEQANLWSASWAQSSQKGSWLESEDNQTADRALRYFSKIGVPQDQIVLGIAHAKSIVPDTFVTRVLGAIQAGDSAKISQNFKAAVQIEQSDPLSVDYAGKARTLRKQLNVWRTLTEYRELKPEIAAQELAQNHTAEMRAQMLKSFDGIKGWPKRERSEKAEILKRLNKALH